MWCSYLRIQRCWRSLPTSFWALSTFCYTQRRAPCKCSKNVDPPLSRLPFMFFLFSHFFCCLERLYGLIITIILLLFSFSQVFIFSPFFPMPLLPLVSLWLEEIPSIQTCAVQNGRQRHHVTTSPGLMVNSLWDKLSVWNVH